MEKQLIPAGYKQTEVGVIPEDWDVNDIGYFNPFVTSGSRGWANYYSSVGSLFVRITNMRRSSIYLDLTSNKYVSLPLLSAEGKRTELQNDDVLISITADVGISGYVDDSVEKPAYINQHIALVRFTDDKIYSKFVSYYLASENIQKLFRGSTDQGAKAGMNLTAIRAIKFAVPTKPEQTAIANALSDVDALIAALEKLINKKSAIKTAAMQQLLTGKKRLPPFDQLNTGYKQTELGEIPGDWDVKTIGELSSSYSGGTPSTGNLSYYSGNIPWITSGDLNKERIDSVNGRISQKGLENSSAKMVEAGTLLFALYGATAGISAITYIAGSINQAVLAIMPNNKCVTEFLFQMFRMRKSFFIDTYTQGGQPNFSGNIVKSFAIAIPSTLEEQTAIANVLSDMDKDLEALQQRLHKTQQIKQGMMQELLTGKTRLVKVGAFGES